MTTITEIIEENATGSMLESRNLTARMSIARLRKPISLLALVMMQMRRRNQCECEEETMIDRRKL